MQNLVIGGNNGAKQVRAPEATRSQVMRVTPEIAAEWLATSTGNRAIREQTVRRYARDMPDNWKLTHQGIAFDTSGRLLDGHHRLHAVLRSGATVAMMVTWGLGRDAALAVDDGVARRLDDRLFFGGSDGFRSASDGMTKSHIKRASSGLNVISLMSGLGKPTSDEASRFFVENSDAIRFAVTVECPDSIQRGFFSASAIAARIMTHIGYPSFSESFWLTVAEGDGLRSGSAEFALREYLLVGLTRSAGSMTARDTKSVAVYKCLSAARSAMENKPVYRLQTPKLDSSISKLVNFWMKKG